jgi:hypothetical protein
VVRVEGENLAETGLGLLSPVLLLQEDTETEVALNIGGVRLEYLTIDFLFTIRVSCLLMLTRTLPGVSGVKARHKIQTSPLTFSRRSYHWST